jgi:hypothetical protein
MSYELVLTFPDGRRITWSVHRSYREADDAGFNLLSCWLEPEDYSILEVPLPR